MDSNEWTQHKQDQKHDVNFSLLMTTCNLLSRLVFWSTIILLIGHEVLHISHFIGK